jgi:glycerophosphoryl diester phosphodiesterase
MTAPIVIGHRGAMGYAPENTLPSFEKGWKMGADGIECDVHLSRDGQLVVIHDPTLDRTTNGKGRVRRHAWREMSRLDAGSWYHRRFRRARLLRLPELLDWLRPKKSPSGLPLKILIEIKNEPKYPKIAERVVDVLQRKKMVDRAMIISFDHAVVRRVKRLSPELRGGILYHKRLADLTGRLAWTRADAIFPLWKLVTPSLIRLAKEQGRFVGVWTVNKPGEMRRMIRVGVDGIATNYPDRLRRLLKRIN